MSKYWLHRRVAERKGISCGLFHQRVRRGWCPVRAATEKPRLVLAGWGNA